MPQLWKYTKLMLVIILTFSLFGCGNSETNKVDSPKVEKSEQSKKDSKEKKSEESKEDSKEESDEQSTVNESNMDIENGANEQTQSEANVESKQSASAVVNKAPTTTSDNRTSNSSNVTDNTTTNQQTSNTNSGSVAPTQHVEPTNPEPVKPIVTISIIGPSGHGTIIGETKETIDEGATVFDVLLQVTKKNDIYVKYSGSGSRAYVIGINNIEAKGSNGWIYKLNGTLVMQGAGAVKVKNGDHIVWSYTNN